MQRKSRTLARRIPQQKRSRATVDVIVEAAAHLLVRRGWNASTTNHIAERAGVSIGSLYKYFPNKQAIVAEVARRRIAAEVSAIEATLAAHSENPRQMLATMVAETADRYAKNAVLDTALMEQLGAIEMAHFLHAAESSVVRKTERYFARHAGTVRADHAAAFVVVHALRGVLVAAAAHRPGLLQRPSFRGELVDMLERYLLT